MVFKNPPTMLATDSDEGDEVHLTGDEADTSSDMTTSSTYYQPLPAESAILCQNNDDMTPVSPPEWQEHSVGNGFVRLSDIVADRHYMIPNNRVYKAKTKLSFRLDLIVFGSTLSSLCTEP